MPQNFHAIHGVNGFVVAVGEGGRILHFPGDPYGAHVPDSPTQATLTSVWVHSPTCAYAVGEQGTVLKWDGQRWFSLPLAPKRDDLHAVWGSGPDNLWIGGRGCLYHYHRNGGSTLIRAEQTVTAIWGSSPEDLFFLCAGRMVLHWTGEACVLRPIPAAGDDEFYALSGSAPDGNVWAGGLTGLLRQWDGERWQDIESGTMDTLSGIACEGDEDVWVTTNAGQLRHWDGRAWHVAALSAFGWLGGVCLVDGVVWAAGANGVVLQHRPDDGGEKE